MCASTNRLPGNCHIRRCGKLYPRNAFYYFFRNHRSIIATLSQARHNILVPKIKYKATLTITTITAYSYATSHITYPARATIQGQSMRYHFCLRPEDNHRFISLCISWHSFLSFLWIREREIEILIQNNNINS
jgi:hypothetical protein